MNRRAEHEPHPFVAGSITPLWACAQEIECRCEEYARACGHPANSPVHQATPEEN